MSERKLLSVKEAASYLDDTERYIRWLIETRQITYVKLGRKVRIEQSVLDSFIEAGRVEAASS